MVVAFIAANCVCLTGVAVGAWLVLRLSGAGEQSPNAWASLQALYLPLMAGVQGAAAIAGGLCIGLVAGKKGAAAAPIAITPLYVITFATGATVENFVWACAYVAVATTAASLVGRKA